MIEEEKNSSDNLPQNWALCTIGDITAPVEKIDPRTDPDRQITYLDISGIDNQANRVGKTKSFRLADAPSRARQIVKSGDVLFSTVRPYLRNIAQVRSEFDGEIASTGFSVLRPTTGIEPSFLFLKALSKEFVDTLSAEQYGASYPAIKDSQVRSQPVAIPPTSEQRRIVEKIETLFARLDKGEEAVREVQKLLTRYRQSVLKSAVTGQLTADWRAERAGQLENGCDLLARIIDERRTNWVGRGKYKDALLPDTSDLPNLPDNWAWASLGQLLRKIEAGKNFKCEERPPREQETGIVKISAVTWDEFDQGESKTITNPEFINDSNLIKTGDLLISRANTIELVGASVVVRDISKRLQLSDKVLRLRLVEPIEDWVNYVLKSAIGRKQIEGFATGAQMSMRNISQGNLERIAVPIPPKAEMSRVVEDIRNAHSRIASLAGWCDTELKRSDSLRQSILKDAFAGRLVPQDPEDEPSSALLARTAIAKVPTRKVGRKVFA